MTSNLFDKLRTKERKKERKKEGDSTASKREVRQCLLNLNNKLKS